MRLLLWVPRSNHIKILGSVAAEGWRRGHDVLAVAPEGDAKGGDALAHAREELSGGIRVTDRWHLAEFRPQWAVAVGLRTAPTLRRLTRRLGVRWAALDHAGDNLTFLLEGGGCNGWDLRTTLSEDARQFAEGLTHGVLGHDLIPIGYPELDQLAGMTRDGCRAKWSVPPGKAVILFGSAARPIRLGRVRRWWFDLLRHRRIVGRLRAWADRHGALLVVKTRAKHRDPAWLADRCDRVVGDECFYPFTTLELLRAADLYVGFASAMAIEACAVGLPQIHLHGWSPWRVEWPAAWPLKRRFFLEGMWDCEGSRQVACYGGLWGDRLSAALEASERPFDRDGQRVACARWAGPLDGQASHRLLDLLEARC